MKALFMAKVGKAIVNHLPGILTGLSIASAGGAVVLAVAATPKAMDHISEKKAEIGEEKLTVKQTVEVTWKDYIPAAGAFLTSAGLSIGSLSVSNRRMASLSAAYEIREALNDEYKEKVKELLGSEKEAEVRREAEKSYVANHDTPTELSMVSDNEDIFCLNGRYFRSTRDKNRSIIHYLNERLDPNRFGEQVTLNDLYAEFGLTEDPSSIHGICKSDATGWEPGDTIEIGYDYGPTPDGRSCSVIYFITEPQRLRTPSGGFYD